MEKPKHPGGRPRKYSQMELDYLAESLIAWVEDHSIKKKFGLLKDWCFDYGFDAKNLARYCDQNENFKNAYDYAKSWQEHIVSRQALTGVLNARFAQFFLGCVHKWRSKEVEDSRHETLGNDYGRFLDYMDSLKKAKEEDDEED